MSRTEPPLPDLASIRRAQERITGHVERTRLLRSCAMSARSGADVRLKLEIDQPTGSFKVRGACNAVRVMLAGGEINGVTTASTGNHARAVAHMGKRFGLIVKAYMAGTVAAPRIRALEELGAQVDRSASDQTEAITAAHTYAVEHGFGFIPPFDHPDVISGQGTLGLELAEDLPTLDTVIIQVSGGGLIGGIGLALKELHPAVRVIGVCAHNSPAMTRSLAAGHPVSVREAPTIATSLMGDLGPHNRYTFRAAQKVIDEIVTVTEDQIRRSVDAVASDEGLAVEPAAAAGAAYLDSAGHRFDGHSIALILTGNATGTG
jgi:threonine dehydratase